MRLEYETSPERPTLRQLADKNCISRSTVFKRAARGHWKQNAAVVEAARKQIVRKMEANMEAATTEAAQLVAKQIVEDLGPWIEREKAEHIRRAVAMGKRGYDRIERMWDESASLEVKNESLAAATLEKHDTIVRRNLGMSDNQPASSSLNLNVLAGRVRRVVIAADTRDADVKSAEAVNIMST
jgi:hypothetical protein